MLDPQARKLLALIEERGLPPIHLLPAPEARIAYRQSRKAMQAPPDPVAEVCPLTMPGPGGPLGLRLYRPLTALATPLPCLVYFHGGGWTIGDLDTHDALVRNLCARSGCAVISVDYRLGPEHRFPAAADDALAACRWVRNSAADLGLAAGRLAVGGDSAGATLAAVCSLALRDAREALPDFQLLIYPATDMRGAAPSHQSNAQGYLLTEDTIRYFRRNYLAGEEQWIDWRASPLLHPDLSGLPPALVLTAGYDPLRDEGLQYADALSAAGTASQYVCFERQIHGFLTLDGMLDEAHTATSLCAQAVRRALR